MSLVGTIAAGVIDNNGTTVTMDAAVSHTFTASKDTYVSVNFSNGDIHYEEVANGAAAPALPPRSLWIAKVVTNGAGITSVVDLRETKPIPGSNLKEGSGPLTHMSSGGALDNLTSVTTRSLDSVTDGATYARVKGAGLTAGVVNSSGLVAGAVTAPAIADAAVGSVHVAVGVSRVYANSNANFVQRSRELT
jgi:hypothetical protein